jgi:predicted membrane protein (TIGR00267 family)
LSKYNINDVLTRGFPYLINTLFDAIFTILGIIVGSSFGSSIDIRAIIRTMVTASISLGVSSGFSVYEAQSIQEERRIDNIEEAMLTDLEGTMITEESRTLTILSALLVFLTPLFACMVTLIPFMFAFFGLISIERSGLYSIVVDLILIFLSGLVFGGEKRLLKGIRMTCTLKERVL